MSAERAVTLEIRLSADPAPGGGRQACGAADAATGADDPDAGEPPGGARNASADASGWLPDEAFVRVWAERAVAAARSGGSDARLAGEGPFVVELSVHLAGLDESRALNRDHRGRDRPTNVLSFPSGLPALTIDTGPDRGAAGGTTLVALGDLVPCPEVIRREAAEQGKHERAHWAHLVVHGTLHLLGLDHEDEIAARAMEAVEVGLLSTGGWPDPYRAMPDEAGR